MTPLGPAAISKKELIAQLSEASRLLELVGAEGFRAGAYANAVRQLEAFEGDFSVLFVERRLSELRGIGKSLAAEMYVLNTRERLEVLDELYAQVPEGVRGLLRVAGLGPKKARVLWENGIEDTAALVAAAEDGRLEKLKGFGAKSAGVLGAAAAFALNARKRLRLDEAEVLAAFLAGGLEELLPDLKLTWAGELRRGLETVGTLKAVLTGVSGAALQEALGSLGVITELDGGVLRGTLEGRALEFTPTEPADFGAALLWQTGDEAFVEALGQEGERVGIEVSPLGLTRTGERLETPSEEAAFAALGLAYIPPERRDLPLGKETGDLITLQDIRGLVHNHSSYSDGAATLREMVVRARELGYAYLAMADHSKSSFYANGLTEARLEQQAHEIAEIRQELLDEGSDFRVLHGLEVDILPDGTLDFPDEILARLDYAVVSVHQHFTLDKVKQTERIVRAVHNPYADILAHMTGRLLLRRPGYEVDIGEVLQACADTSTVVEINTNPRRLDLDWREVLKAKELGCRFAINPDAHHPDGYDDVRYGVLMARKAGLSAPEVINTAPSAEAFLGLLKQKPTK